MEGFLQDIWDRLAASFAPSNLGALLSELFVNLIVGLIVFGVYLLLWAVLRWLLPKLLARTRLDETARTFLTMLIKYAVLIIGAVSAMNAAGINTAAVLASLGIAGLTIGFAAKDAFSNLISGIMIYLDRPFVIGDLVEIGDNYGRVDRITLRSTRIITSDGKMLAVPNADIINKTVASYTNFPHLRLDLPVTVGVHEDLGRVRALMLAIVTGDEVYLAEPEPRVVVMQLNDYNVALELQAWIKDERSHVEQRFALREQVFETLTAAGVDMPLQTLQLAPMAVNVAGSGG